MKRKNKTFSFVIIFIYIIFLYWPIYCLITLSLKKRIDIVVTTPNIFFQPTLDNFKWIFSFSQVTEGLINSLIITFCSVALAIFLGAFFAYALSKFSFKGRSGLRDWTLTVRMLPPIAIVLPMYIIWTNLNLYDTYLSLIITYLAISLPLVIWLLMGFFNQIPTEIEEAARVDGAGYFKTFFLIALPNSIPGIIVAAMLSFIFVWNDMFFAFVLSSLRSTLPVVINSMATTGLEVRWGEMAALGTISLLPALIFSILARNLLIRGFQGLYAEK